MVYQEADDVLVTVVHSADGTEGVISVEWLQVFITEAPCRAKISKFALSIKQSGNCGPAEYL